jgi:DNA modification methylase
MEKPLRLEWRTREEMEDNPQQWKGHPDVQEVALRQMLAEVGWAGAGLYNRHTRRLIDGHLRKKVAKKGEKMPVLTGWWTKEQEAKILLTLDPIGSLATADKDALDKLIASVIFDGSALDPLLEKLVGDASCQSFGSDELQEPADQIERADELRKEWGTEEGQIWEVGPHRVMCGDSTDEAVVARLWLGVDQLFRMIWSDPPFGVSYGEKTKWLKAHGAQKRRQAIKNDSLKPDEIRKLFGNALRVASTYAAPGAAIYSTVPSGSMLPFFINGMEDGGFTFKHSLVWKKNSLVLGRSDYHYRHETILYGWIENGAHYFISDRTQDSVFEIDRPATSIFHPTTKPIELVARMITNSSKKGELVYDPFCGSGSTVLAGAQLGRIVFAVELDPRYLAVQLERLSALGLKTKLIK